MVRSGLSRRTLLALPVALAAGGCLGPDWDELPDGTRMTLATGNRGGVFDRYGEALATVLAPIVRIRKEELR